MVRTSSSNVRSDSSHTQNHPPLDSRGSLGNKEVQKIKGPERALQLIKGVSACIGIALTLLIPLLSYAVRRDVKLWFQEAITGKRIVVIKNPESPSESDNTSSERSTVSKTHSQRSVMSGTSGSRTTTTIPLTETEEERSIEEEPAGSQASETDIEDASVDDEGSDTDSSSDQEMSQSGSYHNRSSRSFTSSSTSARSTYKDDEVSTEDDFNPAVDDEVDNADIEPSAPLLSPEDSQIEDLEVGEIAVEDIEVDHKALLRQEFANTIERLKTFPYKNKLVDLHRVDSNPFYRFHIKGDFFSTIREMSKDAGKDFNESLFQKYLSNKQAIEQFLNVTSEEEFNRFVKITEDQVLFEKLSALKPQLQEALKNQQGPFAEDAIHLLEWMNAHAEFSDFEQAIEQKGNQNLKIAFVNFKYILADSSSTKDWDGHFVKRIADFIELQKVVIAKKDIFESLNLSNITQQDLTKLNQNFADIEKTLALYPTLLTYMDIANHQKLRQLYVMLTSKKNPTVVEQHTIDNLEKYCDAHRAAITHAIELGKALIQSEAYKNQFGFFINSELKFVNAYPQDEDKTIERLIEISKKLHDKNQVFEAHDLLSLEVVISMTLISALIEYGKNPHLKLNEMIDVLQKCKLNLDHRIKGQEGEIQALRQAEEYQRFYQLMKSKIEEIEGYPKDFWRDASIADRMNLDKGLLKMIGLKIAEPKALLRTAMPIHVNESLGYELHLYHADGAKPKLVLFMTGGQAAQFTQARNHQLGLLGDGAILNQATEVLGDITAARVLDNYLDPLNQGQIEIVVAGFDNAGASGVAVAHRFATMFPNTQSLSIAAASTTLVTTEDAAHMNQAGNFSSIRLLYPKDRFVERKIGKMVVDYSDNSYHTFPLMIQNAAFVVDINNHNRTEYGNIGNFLPAMTRPLELRSVYTDLVTYIAPRADISAPDLNSSVNQLATSVAQHQAAKSNISEEIEAFCSENKPLEDRAEIEQAKKIIAYLSQPSSNTTIHAIFDAARKKLGVYLKRPNIAAGSTPELISLMHEIQKICHSQLNDLNNSLLLRDVFKEESFERIHFKKTLKAVDAEGNPIRVLNQIAYEDEFLEFVGFKIAEKDKSKIGTENSAKLIAKDTEANFEISLFTPEDTQKKQRLVINCKGRDNFSEHALVTDEDFTGGDKEIIQRGANLAHVIAAQLQAFFAENETRAENFEIVTTGFGTEGAVATVLGLKLAKKFARSNVQSIGFCAPPFATQTAAATILNQANFTPLRILSPQDSAYNFGLFKIGNFTLTEDTYYTIPLAFRSPGAIEIVKGHSPDLYGDAQALRTSFQRAYILQGTLSEKLVSGVNQAPRVHIQDEHLVLEDFAADGKDLRKVEPVGQLIGMMKYCIALSKNPSHEEKESIKNFFKNYFIAIKDKAFYEKMVKQGYRPSELFGGQWELQRIISPDLDRALKALESAPQEIAQKDKQELILKVNFYRGLLRGDLKGNNYKPAGGGVNGAFFFQPLEKRSHSYPEYLSPHSKYLGVFKPHPQSVGFNLTEWAKSWVGMESALNQKDPDKRVNNEVFAYELFHIFGFGSDVNRFPATGKFVNPIDPNKPGSFCAFIPDQVLASKHTADLNKISEYSETELTIWQASKIFDFLTGNLDGHTGNAFVKFDESKHLVAAANFDYDKAFPIGEYKSDNQYQWAGFAISSQAFTPKVKEMFQDDDELERKIQTFLKFARREGADKFTAVQEDLLRRRVAILKDVVNRSSLADLRNYRITSSVLPFKK